MPCDRLPSASTVLIDAATCLAMVFLPVPGGPYNPMARVQDMRSLFAPSNIWLWMDFMIISVWVLISKLGSGMGMNSSSAFCNCPPTLSGTFKRYGSGAVMSNEAKICSCAVS